MTIGEVFLDSLTTGVITEYEIAWVAAHQVEFNRQEEAAAIRLGRFIDQGLVNLGCRLPRMHTGYFLSQIKRNASQTKALL